MKELKEKHGYSLKQEEKKLEVKKKEKMTRDERIKYFYESTIGESKDLNDQLQDLADFLKEFTKSTACYVGKLVAPKKSIKEDDDERAHIDPDAANVI